MRHGQKTKEEREFLQAVVKALKESPERALGVVEKFTITNPTSVWGKLVSADMQQFLGRKSLAGKLYREVLSHDPQNPNALTGLALIPGTPSREALDFFRRAAERSSSMISYRNLAFKLWETGRFEEAVANFEVLRSMGRRKRDPRLVIAVDKAIREIRKGKLPVATPYSGLGYNDEIKS